MVDRPRTDPLPVLPCREPVAGGTVAVTAGRRGLRAVRRVLALLVLAVLTGCTAPAGRPVQEPAVPSAVQGPPSAGPRPAWRDVTVYFVHGARLAAVSRRVAEWRPQTSVDVLLAGPTRAEVASGLRTSLVPQDMTVTTAPDGDRTAVIAVGREFTGIQGADQLLAVAQVVWTVTQFPEVDQVWVSLDGTRLEVPTDEGLTDRPVDRFDYTSVAPRAGGVASPRPRTGSGLAPPDPLDRGTISA